MLRSFVIGLDIWSTFIVNLVLLVTLNYLVLFILTFIRLHILLIKLWLFGFQYALRLITTFIEQKLLLKKLLALKLLRFKLLLLKLLLDLYLVNLAQLFANVDVIFLEKSGVQQVVSLYFQLLIVDLLKAQVALLITFLHCHQLLINLDIHLYHRSLIFDFTVSLSLCLLDHLHFLLTTILLLLGPVWINFV